MTTPESSNTSNNSKESFRILPVENYLGMAGKDIKFKNEKFFELNPGDCVIQIGNGKNNGTIRTDKFHYPVMYCGSIICQFHAPEEMAVPEKMFAFNVQESEDGESIYVLYGSTGHEIFTEYRYCKKDRTTGKPASYVRFYKPEFVKAQ